MSRGRIRSIKPEFAYSGDMRRLSDSCALFFILLWTQCDDEGKHRNDALELSTKLGRWHQEKVRKFISLLSAQGQLRVSSCSAWVQVTAWSHQKIDRPKQPIVKASEIQWLNEINSTNDRGPFVEQTAHGSDRIGSDQKKSKKEKTGAGDFDFLLREAEPEQKAKPTPPTTVESPPPPPVNLMRSPEDAATALMLAIDLFGSGTQDKHDMEDYLGSTLYKIALNVTGTLSAIRAMSRTDSFRHKHVAALLKDSAERLGIEVK